MFDNFFATPQNFLATPQGVATPSLKSPAIDNIGEKVFAYYIDGGALLHRLRWNKGMTFYQIANAYLSYIKILYPNPIVVFDGYEL